RQKAIPDAVTKVLAVLTDEQKRRWADLFGEPFVMKIYSPVPTGEAPPAKVQDAFPPPDLPERLGRLPGELVKAKRVGFEILNAFYLAALTRRPLDQEKERMLKHLKDAANREEACRDVLWALVNSQEFLKLHGLDKRDLMDVSTEFGEKFKK